MYVYEYLLVVRFSIVPKNKWNIMDSLNNLWNSRQCMCIYIYEDAWIANNLIPFDVSGYNHVCTDKEDFSRDRGCCCYCRLSWRYTLYTIPELCHKPLITLILNKSSLM